VPTGKEHLDYCKKRALEYVERGDLVNAWESMVSDLNKHEETSGHVGIDLGNMLLVSQNLNTKATMKKFIEDFN
jgi:hypothetical protein